MSYELMLQKAVELHQNGALHEAEKLYRQILAAAPENADAWNLLGLVAQAKGLHEQAVECFEKAITCAPQHFPLYFNLAVSFGAMHKNAEAIAAYQKALELQPNLPEAHTAIANIYWEMGKIEQAQAAFEQALEVASDYLPAQVNLAEMLDDVDTLEQLAQRDNIEALYYLGRRAYKGQNYAQAVQYLNKADELSESAEIKFLLGQALENNNDKITALQKYYQALALENNNDEIMTRIADLEAENGESITAEKYYKQALTLNPQNLSAHVNLANLLCNRNRMVEALEEYRQAVLLAPDNPEICYNLAQVVKSTDDFEQALALLFQAFYAAPEHDAWALNIAETLILYAVQEPHKAQTIATNWLEKMPMHIVAQHVAAVLKGEPSPVAHEYNKLLFDNFAPNYEQTLQKIGYTVVKKIADWCGSIKGMVLDLGCGTGLVGQRLKTADNHFIGVDIAPAMLEIARSKDVYAELVAADIGDYLKQHQADLPATIIAADVFCYFGNLAPIFKLCAPKRLIFSVETNDEVSDFAVQINGRYQHNPQWIKEQLQAARYREIKMTELTLRQENGTGVKGMLFDAF